MSCFLCINFPIGTIVNTSAAGDCRQQSMGEARTKKGCVSFECHKEGGHLCICFDSLEKDELAGEKVPSCYGISHPMEHKSNDAKSRRKCLALFTALVLIETSLTP